MIEFPKGNRMILLSEGRLLNLGNATGHPSFVMSLPSPTRCWASSNCSPRTDEYKPGVYILPKHLDEKVARLHLAKLGVKLTELSEEQAAYIGVSHRVVQGRTLQILIRTNLSTRYGQPRN